MEPIERILRELPVFVGLESGAVRLLAGCARNAVFDSDVYLFHEGEAANEFYLLRSGMVAIEIAAAGRPPVAIATLGVGDVVGASWLVPPYRWTFDARAVAATRAVAVDAVCLRLACEADARFGYAMMKRFVPVLVHRLQAARLQILDVYASKAAR